MIFNNIIKVLLIFNKEKTFILEKSIQNRNTKKIGNILADLFYNGANSNYTEILLKLLDEKWHSFEEDIVQILGSIKDPRSIDKLYNLALDIPDYDDMRALATKCILALGSINTPEAIEKLKLLQNSTDEIISKNATSELHHILNEKN